MKLKLYEGTHWVIVALLTVLAGIGGYFGYEHVTDKVAGLEKVIYTEKTAKFWNGRKSEHVVVKRDTFWHIYGPQDFQAACRINWLAGRVKDADCHWIYPGDRLIVPMYMTAKSKAAKPAPKSTAKKAESPKSDAGKAVAGTAALALIAGVRKGQQERKLRTSALPKEEGVFYWNKLGGSPLCKALDVPGAKLSARVQSGLMGLEVIELAEKMQGTPDYTVKLKKGDRLVNTTFLSKNKRGVEIRTNVVVNFEGEATGRVYILRSSGTREVHYVEVDDCCNEGILKIIPLQPEKPQITIPEKPEQFVFLLRPPEIKPTPKPVPKPKIPPQVVQACREWNIRAGGGIEVGWGGGDRSIPVYLDGELGFLCPLRWTTEDGTVNEIVFAGRYHGTSDRFKDWDGKNQTKLVGVGLRQVHPDGSYTLWRLMAGERTSEGSAGSYSHDASWNIVAVFVTHARVDPDGENERHFRAGIKLPLGNAKGTATLNGAPFQLPSYKGGWEVGYRHFFSNQADEVRFFGEINVFGERPDVNIGAGIRAGACFWLETVCVLGGINASEAGVGPMLGVQGGTAGLVSFTRDGVIMSRVANAYSAQGVEVKFTPVPGTGIVPSEGVEVPFQFRQQQVDQ